MQPIRRFILFTFLLITTSMLAFLASCHDHHHDDEPKPALPKCLPLTGVCAHDGTVNFRYGDDGKIAAVEVLDQLGPTLDTFIYDNGRLAEIRMLIFWKSPIQEIRHCYFQYDSLGKIISKIDFYNTNSTFNYDEQNRLSGIDTYSFEQKQSARYLYDDDDNVIKVFFTDYGQNEEYLGIENLSFDKGQTFYAASPELAVLEYYVFERPPTVNNVLSSRISGLHGIKFSPPSLLHPGVQLNSSDYPVDFESSGFPTYLYDPAEYFAGMTYDCK